MTRPTLHQIVDMLDSQAQINNERLPGWAHMKVNFGRALRNECAELSAALGWTLGADVEPDYATARAVAVSIWRHTLSLSLKGMLGDREDAAKQIDENLRHYPRMEVMSVLGKNFTLSGLTLHEAVDMLSVFGALGYAFPALYENVMLGVGLTWVDVYGEVAGEITEVQPCVPTE